MRAFSLVVALSIVGGSFVASGQGQSIEFQKRDVIVFAGGQNVVEAQAIGHLEEAITAAHSDLNLKFRCLAWEGDTVVHQSTVQERWRREAFGDWRAQLQRLGATVVMFQFGNNEILNGMEIENFVDGYRKLLDESEGVVRDIVLISPTQISRPHLRLPGLDYEALSKRAMQFRKATEQIASERRHRYVDVESPLSEWDATRNGIHLAEHGRAAYGNAVCEALGIEVGKKNSILRRAIVEKNRLWNDYWRPANWKCLFGDDSKRIFSIGTENGLPTFREEWQQFPALIELAEANIRSVLKEPDFELPQPKKTDPVAVISSDPADALREFEVAKGFEVNLFASEEMGIANPLCMHWDAEGRLFVACSDVYPQIRPGELPDDKIIVLEDTDGDGTADKSTVFADGLNIPTGIEVAPEGVYVGQNTQLLLVSDRDGDLKADSRSIVFSGLGNGDSHQTINSLVWGPSGDLFFCQGDGIESRVETPWGVSSLYQAGAYRWQPVTLRLEGLLDDFMGPGNPWGIAFDDWGQSVIIDGAGGVSFLSPALLPVKHRLKLPRIGDPGGYCGIDCLSGSQIPADFRGDFVIGDYKKNRVSRFSLRDEGAGFNVEWEEPLIKSGFARFRPIDVKMGPDGAVYVVDFFNSIICHQDDFYRHPDRDFGHGRIWRVSAESEEPLAWPGIEDANLPELVKMLGSQERLVRTKAKLELRSRPHRDESAEAIVAWGVQQTRDLAHLEAICALESLDRPNLEILELALRSENTSLRAYAARVAGRWASRLKGAEVLLEIAVRDAHPRVRMEGVLSCARLPSSQGVEIASMAIEKPMDRWIEYALTQAVHHSKDYWLPSLERGKLGFDGNGNRIVAVLQRVGAKGMLKLLRKLTDAGEISQQARKAAWSALIREGDDVDRMRVLKGDGGQFRSELLGELARQSRPEGELIESLKALLLQPEYSVDAMRLIASWQVDDLMTSLIDFSKEGPNRESALLALGEFVGGRELLLSTAGDPNEALNIRVTALSALIRLDVDSAAAIGGRLLSRELSSREIVTILDLFHSRDRGTLALADNLSELSEERARKVLRIFRAQGRVSEKLNAVLEERAGAVAVKRGYDPGLVKQIVLDAKEHGDPVAGETVFRSTKSNCYACHQLAGVGGAIGPDLTTAGTSIPSERLVEEVVWPTRLIKEGYVLSVVVTESGSVYQGYISKTKDKNQVELKILGTDEIRTLGQNEIASITEIGSAMPTGIAESLTQSELRDLISFLMRLGTPGEFAGDQPRVIRKWRLPTAINESELIFARVSGLLEIGDLIAHARNGKIVLEGDVDEQVAGEIDVEFIAAVNDGIRAWVDGTEIADIGLPTRVAVTTEQPLVIKLELEIEKQDKGAVKVQWSKRP